jgi:hypothetical protein
VQGAGPSATGPVHFSSDWNPAATFPIPPRAGAVPGWPLPPQPPLPINRRTPADVEMDQ